MIPRALLCTHLLTLSTGIHKPTEKQKNKFIKKYETLRVWIYSTV